MELFDGRYEKLEALGSGTFAEVWKVRDNETGVIEALKIYTSRAGIDNDRIKLFTHEFSLLANAEHPNLVKPLHFAISTPEGYPYLRMKYCRDGSMKRYIGQLTEDEAWALLADMSSALNYLHNMEPSIIHQDIKPENILKDGGRYMLSDFGVSTHVKNTINRFSQLSDTLKEAGTIYYMAPERFSENKKPIMANDIWSLGASLYELLSGELPFVMGGLTQINGEATPHLSGPFSETLIQTVKDCLALQPWNRPRTEQLFELAQGILDGRPAPSPLPWKKETIEIKIPETSKAEVQKPDTPKQDVIDDTEQNTVMTEDDSQKWPDFTPPSPPVSAISTPILLLLAFGGLAFGAALAWFL